MLSAVRCRMYLFILIDVNSLQPRASFSLGFSPPHMQIAIYALQKNKSERSADRRPRLAQVQARRTMTNPFAAQNSRREISLAESCLTSMYVWVRCLAHVHCVSARYGTGARGASHAPQGGPYAENVRATADDPGLGLEELAAPPVPPAPRDGGGARANGGGTPRR